MAIMPRLKRILEEKFPEPDELELRGDEGGIIGILTSKKFRRMDVGRRQNKIHNPRKNILRPRRCAEFWSSSR